MSFIGDPQATRELRALVARRTRRRLARLAESLAAEGAGLGAGLTRFALAELGRAGAAGETVLFGAQARAAATNLELAAELGTLAKAALALPRGERRDGRVASLFAAVAETPLLVSLAPLRA